MAYSEKFLTEDEKIIRQFRPHWRLLFIPVVWLLAGIALIVVAYRVPPDNGTVDLITAGVIAIALIPLVIGPFVRWWWTSYVLTNERLITRSGVIARKGIEIPLENVNNVLFSQNVVERILRSGDLLIESAGETGQSRFSDIPDPEEFQALLYRVREDRAAHLASLDDSPGRADDPTARLARLAKLHRDGVITDEEFAAKKQALLDEI